MTKPWPAALAGGWHPVAYSREVKAKPRAAMLMDVPLVLFRHPAGVTALIDRCPHRNVPLSKGQVSDGAIACAYHGWRFGADGTCIATPGSLTCAKVSARAYPVVERAGLVWVSLAHEPRPFPGLLPQIEAQELDRFWWRIDPAPVRVLDALENHLDPAHPHYLHPWLVRKPADRQPVTAELSVRGNGATVRYVEQGNMGWLPRLFEGSRTATFGELLAPATGQVRLENARGVTIAITVIFSPVSENMTRPYAHFASRKGLLPAWLKRWLIIGFHTMVLAQDRKMLALQAAAIKRSGGAEFHVGPLDMLGPVIWQLANGTAPRAEVRTFELML